MKIAITLIDSGGHFTQQVYDFCRKYRRQRCFGTKGSQFPGKPIFERAGRKKGSQQGKVDFFIGTDTAKDWFAPPSELTCRTAQDAGSRNRTDGESGLRVAVGDTMGVNVGRSVGGGIGVGVACGVLVAGSVAEG